MKSDSQVLSDVVIIGYGTQRKSDLTGSVASVGTKDFNKGMVSSPEELVNGKIAGVQIVNGGGSLHLSQPYAFVVAHHLTHPMTH